MKDINADSICIKFDITHNEKFLEFDEDIYKLILECEKKYSDSSFSIIHMHEKNYEDREKNWNCSQGCYYKDFFSTIGSDGCVYPCDYQTLQECEDFGNVIKNDIRDILKRKNDEWEKKVTSNKKFNNICPPFAESINPFLGKIRQLVNKYGEDMVLEAVNNIRSNYN